MKILFLFLFPVVVLVQADDYDISNFQVCTRKPFFANFTHHCSRQRLVENVEMANTDKTIFIFILLPYSVNESILLTVRNRVDYVQKIYFLFMTVKSRIIYFGNHSVPIYLPNSTLSTYFYDPLNDYFGSRHPEVYLTQPTCEYLKEKYRPSDNISRIYYIHTNQSILDFDFSLSTNQILPIIKELSICYGIKKNLTPLGIFLIVFTSVLCLVVLLFIINCLYRQIIPLFGILRNRRNQQQKNIPPPINIE